MQVRLGLEGLDAAILALNLGVGAGEEEGDVGADFVAQGGLGGGEGGLRDEFVVLRASVASALNPLLSILGHCHISSPGSIQVRERGGTETHANGLEDLDKARKVGDARLEGLDRGLEELERGAEGGDAVGVRRRGRRSGRRGRSGHRRTDSWAARERGLLPWFSTIQREELGREARPARNYREGRVRGEAAEELS